MLAMPLPFTFNLPPSFTATLLSNSLLRCLQCVGPTEFNLLLA